MSSFTRQSVLRREIAQYKGIAPEAHIQKLLTYKKKLKGVRVLHINTSARSGGVAEILKSEVPLENELLGSSEWFVASGPPEYFQITKHIHNLLQGKVNGGLTYEQQALYLTHPHSIATDFQELIARKKPTVVVLHDPQPLPFIKYIPRNIPVIVRLHMDLSTPHRDTYSFLRPLLDMAQSLVVSDSSYAPWWMRPRNVTVSMPAIDPLSAKNKPRSDAFVHKTLKAIGVDLERPLVTQISRFDPWKDPIGVIDAYRRARERIPDLQLVLGGLMMTKTDVQASGLYAETVAYANGDPDILIFAEESPPNGLTNDEFVSSLQYGSQVILQKSRREGFGMTVTEAMWKGASVVCGDTHGTRNQIKHGVTGFLVDSDDECAERIVQLVENDALRKKIGKRAKESVRENFLMPRQVLDFCELYEEVLS